MIQKTLKTIILLTLLSVSAYAQDVENEVQYRTSLELNYKIAEGLELDFMPQIRFDDDFSINKYLIEGELSYKTFGFLYWGASYRLTIKPQDYLKSEKDSKYGFSVTAKETYGNITPSLRINYSNYSDDDVIDKEFMRYKAKVKYDIPKCKFTPFVAIEAFQEMNDNKFYKMRYSTGFDYKVKKNNYIKLNYKLDYYNLEYHNKHIISIAYKYNF